MSNLITIAYNIIRKDKINHIGIKPESIGDMVVDKKITYIIINISGLKNPLEIPYESKDEAIKEIERINKELTEEPNEIKSLADLVKDKSERSEQ